jgi:hypothetical protein
MFCFSCLSVHRTDRVGNGPRCGTVFGVNGTAVQQRHHVGPSSINFDGYSFAGASPTRYRTLHPLGMVGPRYATVLGAGGDQAEAS